MPKAKETKLGKEIKEAEKVAVYQPKPDMGNIKPPSETICKCTHEKEFHYGGQYGHCNRPSCPCLKFS